MPTDHNRSVDDRISEELGVDVRHVELHTAFRLDHARMQRGESGTLGYVLMSRQYHPDAAVVFLTPEKAEAAEIEHPVLDSLCEEDCLDLVRPDTVHLQDLIGHEIILSE